MPVACSCAMVQVINHCPLTTQAQVKAYTSPCRVCGGQSGTWTSFSQSALLFPCHYHATSAPHSYFTRVSPMMDHHATGSVVCYNT